MVTVAPRKKMFTEDQVRAQDLRRQRQIKNQVDTINRVMQGGTYTDEMRELHERLAAAEAEKERLEADLSALQAQLKAKG